MKIDNQVKYDFCDLLLRPDRSDLSSRSINCKRIFKDLNEEELTAKIK